MAKMGRYCKAYPIERLEEYSEWKTKVKTTLPLSPDQDMSQQTESDTKYLFLQENFTITNGVFIDENIVFDDVTSQWMKFCTENLNFEIPAELIDEPAAKS